MLVEGIPRHTIWPDLDNANVQVIDQRKLPHQFQILSIRSSEEMVDCIRNMAVRGAPLIGVSGAWGCWLAARQSAQCGASWKQDFLDRCSRLREARPTAVNLAWAVDRQCAAAASAQTAQEAEVVTRTLAGRIQEDDIESCRKIGQYGLQLIRKAQRSPESVVNILTHCNAGWLACVDQGTATAPIYAAQAAGIPIHVWVDETRPRSQGARLTAWELHQQGVPHTLIADNAGGHLMQQGLVDLCIVGADRVAANGDVANKIGTYLKALAAADNGIPFYVALPTSTIDHSLPTGVGKIPIESRSEDEVRRIEGLCDDGIVREVLVCPQGTRAANHGFDVTPARLVRALITEAGVVPATSTGIAALRGPHG